MIGTPADLLSAALSMDTTWPDDLATAQEWDRALDRTFDVLSEKHDALLAHISRLRTEDLR